MEDNSKAETPFHGVIIARDASINGYSKSSSSTIVHLAIKHEADATAENPRIFLHSFIAYGASFQPNLLLRKGHRVRVTSVHEKDGFQIAGSITFNLAELDQSLEDLT